MVNLAKFGRISMAEYSMELKYKDKSVFSSNGKWLYPLFDLEIFLNKQNYDPEKLVLYDKIIGKASALIIIHLGIKKVIGGIVSQPAETAFNEWNISCKTEHQVDLIECKTEKLLTEINDPEEVYRIIKKRAGV
jgi:hypothetical protein